MNLKHIYSLLLLSVANTNLIAKEEKPQEKKEKHYKEVTTKSDYDKSIKNGKLKVIKYYAEWCGACKQMEPHFNKVAQDHKSKADFIAINVDHKELAPLFKEQKIEAVPTTIFLKNGKEVKRERGSLDEKTLEKSLLDAQKAK
jgi:thioredoxin 1